MKSELKTMTIQDIVDMDAPKVLEVDAEYQRGAEWTVKQDRLLIDSLFRGYTVPLFYLHKKTSTSNWASNTFYYIVDGQQRKNAIVRYVKNSFPMFDPVKDSKTGLAHFQKGQPIAWAGKAFDAIPDDLRRKFLATPLQVILLETNDDNEVRDLFIRLQGGLSLSAQEKRDAWPGKFTKFIIETAGKTAGKEKLMGHEFFQKVLKGSTARGNMRKLCATMFMQFYSRKFNKYAPESFTSLNALDIDNFYQYHIDFNSQMPESGAPRFREILDKATQLLGDGKRPKIEANMAYNVILFLDQALGIFAPAWGSVFVKAFDNFQANLLKARKSKDHNDEYWIKYGVMTGVSASSKGRIEERYRFFESKMMESIISVPRFDSTRAYTPAEREMVFYRDHGVCQKCAKAVDWSDGEIDHITPYAVGGQTTLENARLVHKACHTRGVNALVGFTDADLPVETVEKPWEEDDAEEDENNATNEHGQRITINHLYCAGLLADGCYLIFLRTEGDIAARFLAPDAFAFKDAAGGDVMYSSFNMLVSEKVNGARNIWRNTRVTFPNGDATTLKDLRVKYLESIEPDGDEISEDE